MEDFIQKMKARHPNIQSIDAGSSLKFCRVAEGSADVYPRFGPTMEWDTAAGHAIVAAAGGQVRQLDHPAPLSYNKENLLNPSFIAIIDHTLIF
jgi:3'(2'), 5'-bisphosphate nucleotidase